MTKKEKTTAISSITFILGIVLYKIFGIGSILITCIFGFIIYAIFNEKKSDSKSTND